MAETKPRIFIGCTEESRRKGLPAALDFNLKDWSHPEIWNQPDSIFFISDYPLENLTQKLAHFDAAVFLFEGDDVIISRGTNSFGVRDNLLFEFGLAMGLLGRSRTFIILPQSPEIKIPSDLKGLIVGTYDSTHDSKTAALLHCANQIRSKLQETQPDFTRKPQVGLNYSRHPFQIGRSTIMETFIKKVFSEGILRDKWTIDLEYDCSMVNQGKVIEKILWDYSLINITTKPIEYSLTLDLYGDERNQVIEYNITNKEGIVTSLINYPLPNSAHTIIRTSKNYIFEPGSEYRVNMMFQQIYSVNPANCRIHNCFAPKQFTLYTAIRSRIPKGYTMEVLDFAPNKPKTWDATYDFIIDRPLLPEQVIEYIFEKI